MGYASPHIAARFIPAREPDQSDCLSPALRAWQNNPLLILILTLAIRVADRAGLVGAEKRNLAQPFVGVDLGR
jgi:hypothetical protein